MKSKNKNREAIIYTDGSYFQNGNRIGVGWVITREKWRWNTPVTGMKQVVTKGNGSSTIAEIYAVSHALRNTAENSRVTVFTDDVILSRSLSRKSLQDWIASTKKPELSKALIHLFNSLSRHESVTGFYMCSKASPFIEKAHHLARAACSLGEPENPKYR